MISQIWRRPLVSCLILLFLALGQGVDIVVHLMLLTAFAMMLSYTTRPG
jgi:hypothetical protein